LIFAFSTAAALQSDSEMKQQLTYNTPLLQDLTCRQP